MMTKFHQKLFIALFAIFPLFTLTACSDSDEPISFLNEEEQNAGNQGAEGNDTVAEGVTGPLDALQEPLNNDVFGALESAVVGTPLEGTLDCAGQAVVIDLLDVVDAIAAGLIEAAESGDPTLALSNASENIQFSLQELANDLPGALTALAGEDCNGESGDGSGGFIDGSNPLAGTPLAPLGDALGPVLAGLPSPNADQGDDLDLQSLSALVHELSLAFQGGLQQVPAEAKEAPIFGGLLKPWKRPSSISTTP